MINELFQTSKLDTKVIIKYEGIAYTVKDFKALVAGKILEINSVSDDVVICTDNNFLFLINLFASIYAKKRIYVITELQKLKSLNFNYTLLNNNIPQRCHYEFNKINYKESIITFLTSGTTDSPKSIQKSLWNLIEEGKDVAKVLISSNTQCQVITTTSFAHLFGMTFALMMPLCNGFIINANRKFQPEVINEKDAILVTTPAFLSAIQRQKFNFSTTPDLIISAGEKLNNSIFEYFEQNTAVIEVYGSTETGVIAYRKNSRENQLQTFPNVRVLKDGTITSNYIFEHSIKIEDNIDIQNGKLTINGRKDRLVKIYDKRVSLEFLESILKNNEYISDAYCSKINGKLVGLCALSDAGNKHIVKTGILAFKQLLKKNLKLYTDIVPQRWKFMDEIPHNNIGKIDKDFIEKLFSVNCSIPIILNSTKSNNKVIFELFFHKNCNFYKGHFPNFPITPGVVQLYIANILSNNYFNLKNEVGQIKKLKFSNIIYTDSIVKLELTKTDKTLDFIYSDDSKRYSSGSFSINNIFQEYVNNEHI